MLLAPSAAVARALRMNGEPSIYRLGAGGRRPDAGTPFDGDGACDCSGFALWCIGIHRWTKSEEFRKAHGIEDPVAWLDTTRVWADATGPQVMFSRTDVPAPGDLIVFPDRKNAQGHIGVVTQASATGVVMGVAHCSIGNERIRRGRAVQVTAPTPWRRRGDSITCRPVTADQGTAPGTSTPNLEGGSLTG